MTDSSDDNIGIKVRTFNYDDGEGNRRAVRVLKMPGMDPLFAGIDIGASIGYTNVRNVLRAHCQKHRTLQSLKLTEAEKEFVLSSMPNFNDRTKLVTESDVYKLMGARLRVMSISIMEKVERFRNWFRDTLLPELEKMESGSAEPRVIGAEPVIGAGVRTVDLTGIFVFGSHDVRALRLTDCQQVMMSAGDVANALGYSNRHQAVIDSCKDARTLGELGVSEDESIVVNARLKASKNTRFIGELDVFRLLVARARASMAGPKGVVDDFQEWMLNTVNPRMTASPVAAAPPATGEVPATPATEGLLSSLRRLQGELVLVQRENAILRQANSDRSPAHMPAGEIAELLAPYLTVPRLCLVLQYYGHSVSKTPHTHPGEAVGPMFLASDLNKFEGAIEMFVRDSGITVSRAGTSAILDHPCFDGDAVRVPRKMAVDWLGLSESDFAAAAAPGAVAPS